MMILLVHLGSVAILALAVELACRVGRFRPAICHALWLVVLVKLVVPPVLSWPVSMELLVAEAGLEYQATPTTTAVEHASPAPALPVEGSIVGEGIERRAIEPVSGADRHISFSATLFILWIAGGVWVGIGNFRQLRRARRTVAAGTVLPAWLRGQLAEICARLGLHAPPAVCVDTPAGVHVQIAGAPILVVSTGALEHVAAERWPAVLTHELAHLKRRDHWVAWLLLMAGAVWWWNPLFWWIRRRVSVYSELACDAWVVHTHPEGRRAYAETMVQFMTLFSRQQAPAPVMGLAAWSGADQKRRLKMIMQGNEKCTMRPIQTLGLVALAALLAPMWIALAAEEEPVPLPESVPIEDATWVLSLAPSDEVLARLDTQVTLRFKDTHIGEASTFIQMSYDVNLVLDQRVVAPPTVAGQEAPENQIGCAPYVTDGMIESVDIRNVPLKNALTDLARPLGLMYQVRGSTVFLSSRAQLLLDQSAPLPHAVPEGSGQVRLGALLEKEPVDWHFESTHLMDVLEEIQDKFDINVVLDKRAVLRTGGDPQVSDPRWPGFEGYASDGMVREIHLMGVPLGEALYTVSRLLNVSYSVQAGFLFVSTDTIIAQDGFRKPVEGQ